MTSEPDRVRRLGIDERAGSGLTFDLGRRSTVGGVSTMRISQLAERSGVPATALRFYEGPGSCPRTGPRPATGQLQPSDRPRRVQSGSGSGFLRGECC